MTKSAKIKVKDTLSQFLFNQIESNPEYQEWVRDYQLPTYITDNLSKTLRDYSVHDKFHRTLILSGFCLLKIAKISLNSSFFPKPIKR